MSERTYSGDALDRADRIEALLHHIVARLERLEAAAVRTEDSLFAVESGVEQLQAEVSNILRQLP